MKDKRIDMRISEQELAAIDRRAKAAGLARTTYLIEIGINGHLSTVSFDTEPLRKANWLLANATGNMNQIARRLNEYGLDSETLGQIVDAMANLDAQIQEMRGALNAMMNSKGVKNHDNGFMRTG